MTVRVLPEDSLRTFFEKFRDAFHGDLPAENITSAYQIVNHERKFFYKATDQELQDLRKQIKDCDNLDTNLPVYLTFRQDLSGKINFNERIIFCISFCVL